VDSGNFVGPFCCDGESVNWVFCFEKGVVCRVMYSTFLTNKSPAKGTNNLFTVDSKPYMAKKDTRYCLLTSAESTIEVEGPCIADPPSKSRLCMMIERKRARYNRGYLCVA
jgi:hypothetical protein